MKELRKQAQIYKEMYPKGTRIMLISMGDDPRPIGPNTKSTVKCVDDIGTVHCQFDDGRSLGLIPNEDSFRKLTEEELLEENENLVDEEISIMGM